MALLALIEMRFVKLNDVKRPSPIDVRGAVLIVAGMGLAVLGIQQSTRMGLGHPGHDRLDRRRRSLLLAAFVAVERSAENPLIDVRRDGRQPAVRGRQPAHFLVFGPWLAVFFFGSMYFQVAVGQPPTQAGFSILTMFYSFFVAARIGGGWMDKYGAEDAGGAAGFLLGAIGMVVWAQELSELTPHRRRSRAC